MRTVDLVIIGGGITGAGCLLEAVARGLNAVLVEKGDFSSGTTAASSRLIHGGIRYLEQFHFGLVSESLKERFFISQTFPHLLRPLAIHIPVYGWGKRSPLIAGLGVKLYDFLAGRMKVGKSAIVLKNSALNMVPGISEDGLSGLFIFHDYQILMPERLVLEYIFAAEKMGGTPLNYTTASDIKPTRDGFIVTVKKEHTGEHTTYKTRTVINASGAWIDEIRKMAGFHGKLLRPTKGVHIEVQRLSDTALFAEAETDGRLFFITPFMDHTIIGTTDTDFNGSPDDVYPLPEDVTYLIDNANRILTSTKLRPSQVYSAYCGLRPLSYVPGKSESAIPRKHRVVCEGPGGSFLSITGGKLTTHRKMAEDTIYRLLEVMGNRKKSDRREAEFSCGKIAPEEKDRFTDHLENEYDIERKTAASLLTLYGMKAEKVLEFAKKDPFLRSSISNYTHEIPAQVLFGFENESAHNLEDILLRRMLLGKSPQKGLEAESSIKKLLTHYSGKNPGEARDIFDEVRHGITRKFRLKPADRE